MSNPNATNIVQNVEAASDMTAATHNGNSLNSTQTNPNVGASVPAMNGLGVANALNTTVAHGPHHLNNSFSAPDGMMHTSGVGPNPSMTFGNPGHSAMPQVFASAQSNSVGNGIQNTGGGTTSNAINVMTAPQMGNGLVTQYRGPVGQPTGGTHIAMPNGGTSANPAANMFTFGANTSTSQHAINGSIGASSQATLVANATQSGAVPTFNAQAARQQLLALAQYMASPTFPSLVVWRSGHHDSLCVRGPPNAPIEFVNAVLVGRISGERAYVGPRGTFNPRWADPLKNAKAAKWQVTLECPVDNQVFAQDWPSIVNNLQMIQGQVAVTTDKRHTLLPGEKIRLGRNVWEKKVDENSNPTRNAITNNYPIDQECAQWWALAKETMQINLMPVYDVNDNLNTRVETWEAELVGALVEVTFTMKHYYMGVTPTRPEPYDVFSGTIESISVLEKAPATIRNPYRGSVARTKPRHVTQGVTGGCGSAVVHAEARAGGSSTATPPDSSAVNTGNFAPTAFQGYNAAGSAYVAPPIAIPVGQNTQIGEAGWQQPTMVHAAWPNGTANGAGATAVSNTTVGNGQMDGVHVQALTGSIGHIQNVGDGNGTQPTVREGFHVQALTGSIGHVQVVGDGNRTQPTVPIAMSAEGGEHSLAGVSLPLMGGPISVNQVVGGPISNPAGLATPNEGPVEGTTDEEREAAEVETAEKGPDRAQSATGAPRGTRSSGAKGKKRDMDGADTQNKRARKED